MALPKFDNTELAVAMTINNVGEVVGRSTDNPGGTSHRVFKWSASGGLVDLLAPAGYPESLDINDAGQVVATINAGAGGRVPYLYEGGVWYNLNDLIPSGGAFLLQRVRRINNLGQIVGDGTDSPPTELGQGFVITPTAVNSPPILAPIGNKTVKKDSLLTFIASATDSERPHRILWPSHWQLEHRPERLSIRLLASSPGRLRKIRCLAATR